MSSSAPMFHSCQASNSKDSPSKHPRPCHGRDLIYLIMGYGDLPMELNLLGLRNKQVPWRSRLADQRWQERDQKEP